MFYGETFALFVYNFTWSVSGVCRYPSSPVFLPLLIFFIFLLGIEKLIEKDEGRKSPLLYLICSFRKITLTCIKFVF